MSELSNIFDAIGKKIVQDLGEELAQQGHKASGKLIESLRYEKAISSNIQSLRVYGNDYGQFLEKRNHWRNKMPPIQPLVNWINILKTKGRFSTVKNVRSLAFAIAKTMKKEGMPTIGSLRGNKHHAPLSSVGRRTAFVHATLKKNKDFINNKLAIALKRDVALMVRNSIRQSK